MNPRSPTDFSPHQALDTEDEYFDAAATRSDRGLKAKRLMLDLLGRWYWVALGLVLGLLCSSYYLSKAPRKYTATATLLIKQQTSSVMSRDMAEEIDLRSIEGLNTVAERIRRHELLEKVASRNDIRSLPGLIPGQVDWRPQWLADWMSGNQRATVEVENTAGIAPPPPSALAGWIGSWMNISIRRGTRLLDISFTHEVPDVAKALADAVAREYLAELSGTLNEGRDSKSDILSRQSEETRTNLQAAESALATYTRALDLHKALEARENANSQLARRYLPKHPRMIASEAELNDLKERFLDEFTLAMDSPSDKDYWQTVDSQIQATRDDPDARLRLARQLLLARTSVLRGEITSLMSVFNVMLTRIEESNVNREGEASNAEISSFARVPGAPSSPQPRKIHTNGVGGGIAFGLAIALLLVRLDNKLHSVAQVEEVTGLPVLAAIADINPGKLDQAIRAQAKKGASRERIDPQQELWDPHLLFRPGAVSTNFAEMFRILRASISLLGDESTRKVTLFSSALPGEGKSLISANFALAAAGQGRKTLIIDLDLRKPSIHRVFGFTRAGTGPGTTDWLAGQVSFDKAVVRDVGGGENLHVMFSGQRAPNPGELLNVARLKLLFDEACRAYDHVVIDTAPLLAVPDTRVIIPLVSNFALVARADYVPKGAVLRTLELLETADSPPSGVVFNGFKESRRMIGQNYTYGSYRLSRYGRPYQYGYGTYGSYGSYGSDDDDNDEKEISKRKRRKRGA